VVGEYSGPEFLLATLAPSPCPPNLEDDLPLFTEVPRRGLLGNWQPPPPPAARGWPLARRLPPPVFQVERLPREGQGIYGVRMRCTQPPVLFDEPVLRLRCALGGRAWWRR
jgi:hypothetical protein